MRTLLILLIFSLTSHGVSIAGAADSTYLSALEKRVVKEEVFYERMWLRLGHWHKKIFVGYKSEVDGLTFFLDAEGKFSPEKELITTLRQFAEPLTTDATKHAQCRFLARRNWLFSRLQIDESQIPKLPCAERMEWKQKLNAEGVSLIFASAYMNNAASMFGHTFLKFHSRENKVQERDLLNYGVGFAANTADDGAVPFALLGLMGGYPGTFTLLPYHQTLREYVNLEGRDIWEYRLRFSPEELDRLINHLLELEQTYFDYYFFDENCSYQLLTAFEVAKPELDLTNQFIYFVIPADTVRVVHAVDEFVEDISFRPALVSEFRKGLDGLDSSDLALIDPLVEKDLSDPSLEPLKERSPEKQAAILDGALRLGTIRFFKDPEAYKNRSHALKVRRAQLGVVSPEISRQSYTATRPEQGHDPSQLAAGVGVKGEQTYFPLQIRAAFQNLLSSEVGYMGNTNLEIMRIGGRVYNLPAGGQQFRLKEVRLVDLLSASPIDRFFTPLAWRVDFGFNQPEDRSSQAQMALSLNGGVGSAVEPWKTVSLLSFFQIHNDVASDIGRGHRIGASFQMQTLLRPLHNWRVSLGAEYRSYFWGEAKAYPSYWVRQSFSLARNWELRADWNRTDSENELQGLLISHFLF